MKRTKFVIIVLASVCALSSCTDLHNCKCSVNGQIQQFPDSDMPCSELQNNYPQNKDLSGSGGSTGIYCTEM